MGFFRQECWSGLPFPPLGNLPEPVIESEYPMSPFLASRFITTEPPGKHTLAISITLKIKLLGDKFTKYLLSLVGTVPRTRARD